MQIFKFTKIILVLLSLQQVCSITQEKLYSSDGKTFFYIENEYKYDWFESLTKCTRMNMSLLTLDSKTKTDNINQIVLKNFGKSVVLWVGGYAVGLQRQYTWLATGEEFSYTFWSGSNPDFYNKEEYCVHIGWGADMKWNDNNCLKKFGFICEFKPQECKNVVDDNKNYKNQNIIINNYQKS